MSPQLHYWAYGYYQHQFLQMIRGEGYRPLAFMYHGLSVAFFGALCFMAALALRRVRDPAWQGRWVGVAGTALLVVLCKSLASGIYSLFALAVGPLLQKKSGARILLVVLLAVVSYPASRAAGLFPADDLVELAARVSGDRAHSLAFRFQNEDELLGRAMMRPIYGWGTFGRNRIYAEWGQDMSATDGKWIIVLGMFGLAGLAGMLLLVTVPVLRYAWNQHRMPMTSRTLGGYLALMVTICMVDILPNAWGDALPLALAGALLTMGGSLARGRRRRRPTSRSSPRPVPGIGAEVGRAGLVQASTTPGGASK